MYVFNLNQIIFSISVRRTMLVEMHPRYLIEAFYVKMKKKYNDMFFLQTASKVK